MNFFTTISHTYFKIPKKREPISFNKLEDSKLETQTVATLAIYLQHSIYHITNPTHVISPLPPGLPSRTFANTVSSELISF